MGKRKLINIHCHALYGVDDGAKSFEESIKLFEMAREEGVCEEILTPHHLPGMDRSHSVKVMDHFKRLEEYAADKMPDFRIHLGNEIFYSHNSVSELREKNIFTLAGSRYVLVEFSFGVTYDVILTAVRELISSGYIPIIAHMERFSALYGKEDRVVRLIETGALIQVNSRSFMGGLFDKHTRWLISMLKKGNVHFIADDHHSVEGRSPLMKSAYEKLSKKCDLALLDRVFIENQKKVIENRLI